MTVTFSDRIKRVAKIYKAIPTLLTLGNILCGFTAILNMLFIYKIPANQLASEVPRIACLSAWLIAGAMLFDMLDGWTARQFNATSDTGLQMDSLADMVTFGVAPAIMVAVLAHALADKYLFGSFKWVWLMCCIYVACVALRLALYNVIAISGKSGKVFRGLPSPGGAAAVASLIFVYRFCAEGGSLKGILATICQHPLYDTYISSGKVGQYILFVLPIYAGFLGLLMISPIPYIHFGKWLAGPKHHRWKMAVLILYGVLFAFHPLITAFLSISVYVFFPPVRYLFTSLSPSHKAAQVET
ncbi:MAG: hypothetical protein D6820_10550 [Lentisphaerae bacterium]|nr:MAG: hypothetical protein D6820_10550 [Lentisphaerota bacterium]